MYRLCRQLLHSSPLEIANVNKNVYPSRMPAGKKRMFFFLSQKYLSDRSSFSRVTFNNESSAPSGGGIVIHPAMHLKNADRDAGKGLRCINSMHFMMMKNFHCFMHRKRGNAPGELQDYYIECLQHHHIK